MSSVYSWELAKMGAGSPGGGASSGGGGLTPIIQIYAEDSFASMGSGTYLQRLGGSQSLNSVSESTGVVQISQDIGYGPTSQITGPSTIGSTWMRFGKIVDPVDSGRTCFFFAAQYQDGITYSHLGRVEMGLGEYPDPGYMDKDTSTYWVTQEMYLPTLRFSGGNGTLMQIHHSESANPRAGPFQVGFQSGAIFNPPGNPGVMIDYQTDSTDYYPWGSDTNGAYGFDFDYPRDTWVKYACKYRGSPTGSTGILQIWIKVGATVTQIVNLTGLNIGINTPGYPNDYAKAGLDDESGGGSGQWELRRSFGLYLDAGYTYDQIFASMP